MTEAGEKWVAQVHKKRGFPKTPAWPDQAEHYIRAFCSAVDARAKEIRDSGSCLGSRDEGFNSEWEAFDELRRELLGG